MSAVIRPAKTRQCGCWELAQFLNKPQPATETTEFTEVIGTGFFLSDLCDLCDKT